jgi:hypothetical protein
MTSIDPTVVRGFLDGIEGARSSGSNALAALLNVDAAAPATVETLARVDASATDLAAFSAKLDAATHLAAPRAGAEAAIDMSMLGVGEAQHHVAQLRSLLAAGPTDPAAAVAHASAARGALDRLLDDEYERLASLATNPGEGDAAVLGAAGDTGAWRSFDELADDELAQAAARIGDPEADTRALMGELEDTLRTANDHIHDGPRGTSAFDEEIAAGDLASELDRPGAVEALAATPTSARASFDAQVADLQRSAPLDAHGGTAPARAVQRNSGARAIVSGEAPMLDHTPRSGERLATSQVARYGTTGGTTHLDVPLVSTGRSYLLPTRDTALAAAHLEPKGQWLVLPNADGGWTLAEARLAGEHATGIDEALHYQQASINGLRQDAAHIDSYVRRGTQLHLATPDRSVDEVAASHPVPDDLRGLAVVRRNPSGIDFHMPETGTPVIRLRAGGEVGVVGHHDGSLIEGDRAAALDELRARVASRHTAGVVALVRLDPGRYAAVRLDGFSGGTARQLAKGVSADSFDGTYGHDVEAIMSGSRHRAAGIDLRSGESL